MVTSVLSHECLTFGFLKSECFCSALPTILPLTSYSVLLLMVSLRHLAFEFDCVSNTLTCSAASAHGGINYPLICLRCQVLSGIMFSLDHPFPLGNKLLSFSYLFLFCNSTNTDQRIAVLALQRKERNK